MTVWQRINLRRLRSKGELLWTLHVPSGLREPSPAGQLLGRVVRLWPTEFVHLCILRTAPNIGLQRWKTRQWQQPSNIQLTLFFGFLSARPRADGGLLLVPVTVPHELPCTTVATAPPAAVLTIPPLTLPPLPLAEPSLPPPLPQRIVVHGDGGLGALGGGKMYSISTQHAILTIHTPIQSTRPLAPLRFTSHIYYKPSTWNRPSKPATLAERIRFVGAHQTPTTSSQLQMHSQTKVQWQHGCCHRRNRDCSAPNGKNRETSTPLYRFTTLWC